MVRHLPPSIKHLLALRNPNSWPSPPRAKLDEVFTRTLKDAKAKSAEPGWLVLATCTLLTTNRPAAAGYLYHFATRSDPADAASRRGVTEATNIAALMREAALKSAIFVGVPRMLLSLAELTEALEDDVKSSLRTDSLRTATPGNIEDTIARGRALWQSIYHPHAEKLLDKLASYHPDVPAFIIQSYGSVLAPFPGDNAVQGNLTRTLGSVVGTACLRAEGRVGPQLVSHVFGLLKARNHGAEGGQLSAGDAWLASDEGAEWVIRTVDTIVDSVKEQERGESRVHVKL